MRKKKGVKKKKINSKIIYEFIKKYYKLVLLIVPLLPLSPRVIPYIENMYKMDYSKYYKLPSLHFVIEINSYYWFNRILGLLFIIWYIIFLIQTIIEPLTPEDKKRYTKKQKFKHIVIIRIVSAVCLMNVAFIVYVVVTLFIAGTGYQIKPEKIKQYEIAFLEDGSKKVILSRKNPNYYLGVDFEIQEEENLNCKIENKKCKTKKLILKTKDYHDIPIVEVKKINWETFDKVGVE